ncbi:multidrug resistance-associated protein 1-like isoform X2 [Thrips palmi]|uniref:ABC-type glutathione-S-conjugate transporter n=1 Tax=Thrips palmi TaxID=161013 RepID=A0A6P8YGB9_THRPL|nr:multidrug resistance-associated protein 1-like isoform X2 [Thrips palmi]
MRTSGVLFMFWAIHMVIGALTTRTSVNRLAIEREKWPNGTHPTLPEEGLSSLFLTCTWLIGYPLIVLLFLLNCWADAEPKLSLYAAKVDRPCPEGASSFLCRAMFAWLDPLVYKGFRRPLVISDIWGLNEADTSVEVVPAFDKYWLKSGKPRKDNSKEPSKEKASENGKSNHASNKSGVPNSWSKGEVELEPLFTNNAPGQKGGSDGRQQTNIMYAMCRAFGGVFLAGCIAKLFETTIVFVSPQILSLLISFVEGDEPAWRGYMYAVLMLLAATFQTLSMTQHNQRMYIVGMRIRTALISAIYRKALRVSNSLRKELTLGEIVNLMAVDAQRFTELMAYINLVWAAPLQIILALYFLYQTLGISAIAGIVVLLFMVPVNAWLADRVESLQISQMELKDERVKLTNEVLGGMKILKLYAWEGFFGDLVQSIRNKELGVLKANAYLNGSTCFIWVCAPFLVSLASFGMYVMIDENNVLDAKKAFVSVTLFNIIKQPFTMLPILISNAIQASVSVSRINKFLNADELDPNSVTHDPREVHPIIVENGTFSWGPDETPALTNINLRCEMGRLVAVVGPVASGKSSLIACMMGEMDKLSGRVNTKGTIAYVAQQAWIQNATLRDNILFGLPMEKEKYNMVVEACALKADLEMLPGGDQTEIGEKGVNVSGGQKQRIALARAVYNSADVYLLDDPLSAVDSHVGKHIFEHVIGPNGLLRNKTRVLVTHGIHYLPETDLVVVLDDGNIAECAPYQELIDRKGEFSDFVLQHLNDGKVETTGTPSGPGSPVTENPTNGHGPLPMIDGAEPAKHEDLQRRLSRKGRQDTHRRPSLGGPTRKMSRGNQPPMGRVDSIKGLHRRRSSIHRSWSKVTTTLSSSLQEMDEVEVRNAPKQGERLTEAEVAETGSVSLKVYSHYCRAGGLWLCFATMLFNALYQACAVGTNVWLTQWSADHETAQKLNTTMSHQQRDLYLGIYGLFGFGQALTLFISDVAPRLGAWYAAKVMHDVMLHGVVRAPLSFHDVTPQGRILSRFSKDVDVMDNLLPQQIADTLWCMFEVCSTLVVISVSMPIFMTVIIPIAILYYFIQRFYVATSRQLKRLESVTRSPIYSHFGESVTGAATIRAYNVKERFIRDSEIRVDINQSCFYPSIIAARWLSVRLETVGNLIIFFAALFAVMSKDTVGAGLVGLSISYALQVTSVLNLMVRLSSEVESNIVAVERLKEYGNTPEEAAWTLPDKTVAPSWPEKGAVNFIDYKVRYREGLDLVLKGLSFGVSGGQKVGIVGRTGAGKSSLTLALFRIVEAADGKIIIDDVDISTLGLHELRSRITIIPQDPVLFSGSLRMNLDPFAKHSDAELWTALTDAHLKSYVEGEGEGLELEVTEGGENLSVGQRQLVCLARALLRRTRVLVMDEATAGVDLDTDDLIQSTIRTKFKDSTVLTIAHRLNTIVDSDMVLVLDQGKLLELDSPERLLNDKSTVFYSMAKDAGLVS